MKSLQTFKFTYNTTTLTVVVDTAYVNRTPRAKEVIRETPTGASFMQIYGSGKYSWFFAFPTLTAREVLTVFNTIYSQQSSFDITMQEEQDDGSFTSYSVIIRRPAYTPDALDSSSPIDRGLTVEVVEA